jgi:hypothetical protein
MCSQEDLNSTYQTFQRFKVLHPTRKKMRPPATSSCGLCHCRLYLFFLLLGGWVLPGATCDSPPRRKAVSQAGDPGVSENSKNIVPVPGSGANWSPGGLPPLRFGTNLLTYINNYRAGKGLAPLVWHDGLGAVSQLHSQDIFNRNYFSLVTPEGVDIYQRLVSSSPPIHFSRAYAFIAQHNNTKRTFARQVFQALLASSVGRAAMDNPTMTHFGGWHPFRIPQATLIFGKNVTP